jgi:DNA-binding IclR family transcriptional regulator
VLRAADALLYLAAHPADAYTVSEIAQAVDLPRATCDTILLALAERGFVRRDRGRYTLGGACAVVGHAAEMANPALRIAATAAEQLARSLGAFVAVSTRDRTVTRVVQVFDHGPPLGLRARVGETIALVAPFGATFVAWDDNEAVQRWLTGEDPAPSTAAQAEYQRALSRIRRAGFSVMIASDRSSPLVDALARPTTGDTAQRNSGRAVRPVHPLGKLTVDIAPSKRVRVAQVSAPVFGPRGRVDAVILLLGPNHELTGTQVKLLGERVRNAAQTASTELQSDRDDHKPAV